MRRLLELAIRPSLLGAAYVGALTFYASQAPIVAQDDGALGAQAQEVSAFVVTRFGGEIRNLVLAIGGAAVAVGLVLGALAGWLVQLRQTLADRVPLRGLALGARTLGVVATLHGWLVLDAMARSPQLYAESWYGRGGLRRLAQVLATDVLGPRGTTWLGLAALVVYLASPRVVSVLRRHARLALAATALVALVASFPQAGVAHAADRRRPNVIVLAIDSMRADRLTPTVAPNLSELAKRGVRFDNAYVSLPRTFPSWVTILTGRHSHHHGVRSMFPRWEDRQKDFDALPERLRAAGYATAVVSDYAGDVFSRIDLGFERTRVPTFDFRQLVRQRALERQTPLLPLLHSRLGRALFPVLREMNVAADPRMLEADAEGTLDELASGSKPFFLTVFFSTAHFPYAAPAPFYARFTDPSYRGRFKYHKPVGLGAEAALDGADVRQVRALYDGAVASVDDAIGRLLTAVETRGLRDRTVVVVTADHGETIFDHGHGQGHGDHLFGDEATHVPLVVVDPEHLATGTRDARIARDVDIAPTLYDATGVAPPADLDGVSLAKPPGGLPAFAESELWMGDVPAVPDELRLPYPKVAHLLEVDTEHHDELVLRKDVEAVTLVARHRMVRDARWKLLYVPTRRGVRYLLWDVQRDPSELEDVAAAHPDVVGALRGTLWQWMLGDARMVERGGYLVPRELHAETQSHALRIP